MSFYDVMFLFTGSGSWYHKRWQRKTSSRIFYPFQWLEQKVVLDLHACCVFFMILSNVLRHQELVTCLWLNQLTLQQITKCGISMVLHGNTVLFVCLFVYFLNLIYGLDPCLASRRVCSRFEKTKPKMSIDLVIPQPWWMVMKLQSFMLEDLV